MVMGGALLLLRESMALTIAQCLLYVRCNLGVMAEQDVDATLIADVFARDCASRDLLADVVGKWAVLALLALDEGGYRFNALRRRVQGVSEKMLSQTLQVLERDGLVVREVVTAIPPRVEYALTPLGS